MAVSNRRGLLGRWDDFIAVPRSDDRDVLERAVRARHPRFVTAVLADARITAERRGERHDHRSTVDGLLQALRLAVVTDAFLGLCCYRAKAASQARGIPLLPRLLHRLAIMHAQITIGDPVVVAAGVYIPHGFVVADGLVEIQRGVVLNPYVNIGLRGGVEGPTLEEGAMIGTGAKVIGKLRVGAGARIGANAVVLSDIPPGASAVGVPARVVTSS